jgi:hypothetical protein
MPYEQRGRHRRILLADLLKYQQEMRNDRRESLDRMAQEGQAAGLHERRQDLCPRPADDNVPPATTTPDWVFCSVVLPASRSVIGPFTISLGEHFVTSRSRSTALRQGG